MLMPMLAVVRLPLRLRERAGLVGRCSWSWRAAAAVRVGERMAVMGEVATVRLERLLRSLGGGGAGRGSESGVGV
jgi:hypothetical protein